jgi:hypothetical protein
MQLLGRGGRDQGDETDLLTFQLAIEGTSFVMLLLVLLSDRHSIPYRQAQTSPMNTFVAGPVM